MNYLKLATSDLYSGYAALKPPNRVSVSEGARDNLIIRQTGTAGGPWSAAETPYMVEPMDMLASRKHEAEVFVGPARTGKCLDLDTPIPTPGGWTTMRDIKVGDQVFSDDGLTTKVLAVHAIKRGLPCYEVKFCDGSTLITDSEHLWGVERFYTDTPTWRYRVQSTESMIANLSYGSQRVRYRYRVRNRCLKTGARLIRNIVAIQPVSSRPVRCIQVDAPSSLFLAGEGMVPTHNTAGLLLGWLAHNVVNDPGDMLFIQMSKDKAREFSKTDLDRAINYSPAISAMKSGRVIDSNTFDTMFRHGMWMRTAWPTVSNVSGSTYRYTACTDIDRIENADNVDGEGPLFDLMRKRTTTFLSRGMSLVESSPGKPVIDPNWIPATPHEAPPVTGVLGIYNRSDRRRWYWQCPDCSEHFEAAPGLRLFNLPSDEDLLNLVRSANISELADEWGSRIVCPHCGSLILAKHKTEMNRKGIWLPEGMTINSDGVRTGTASRSTIVGYWLGGVAAAYQPWKSLVERYLQGLRDYALTGSEETLKTTVNTDQGMPYTSRHLIEARGAGTGAADRAEIGLQRFICPPETRVVVVSVDVQGGQNSRFVVQAHAVGPWMEQWVIDRREIRLSRRPGTGSEFAPLDPARYPEDWDLLTDTILRATYRTDDINREIRVKMLVVDSGGEDGATANAYAWYRKIRKLGMQARVRLYKGGSIKNAPAIKETLVGQRSSRETGDIPLLLCNTNLLSDAVDAGLKRGTPGPGYIHLPAVRHEALNPDGWVGQAFFDEWSSEVRDAQGTWRQIRKRNESFDLGRMVRVGMLALGLDKIKDWTNGLPDWLKPLHMNSETVSREDRRSMQSNEPVQPAVVAPRAARVRRSASSSYLR